MTSKSSCELRRDDRIKAVCKMVQTLRNSQLRVECHERRRFLGAFTEAAYSPASIFAYVWNRTL
jgi:hypothetical protein